MTPREHVDRFFDTVFGKESNHCEVSRGAITRLVEEAIADDRSHSPVVPDIHTRLATLSKRVLDRLRAADGFTTVGSLYDEDFAGDVAQLRQAIEDYENG